MAVETGKNYIGKVRAFSRQRDSLALRLGLSNLLSMTELHPPGLSPSAILCIRRLHDPLPGMLRSRHGATQPSHAWELALLAELQRLAAQAAHPIDEDVGPDVNAVIFVDRAELMACLTSDWCQGRLDTRWWWSNLFKGKALQDQLIPFWLEQPEYVPAALHHLAVRREVLPFVRHLAGQSVQILLDSIIYRFALSPLQTALKTSIAYPFQDKASNSAHTAPVLSSTQHVSAEKELTGPGRDAPTPWQTWVPESSSLVARELSTEQQLLLGIGLMIQRAPTIVRSASFALAVQQWHVTALHVKSAETLQGSSASALAEQSSLTNTPTNTEDAAHRSAWSRSSSQNTLSPPDTQVASETLLATAPLVVPRTISAQPEQPISSSSSHHSERRQVELISNFEVIDKKEGASESSPVQSDQLRSIPFVFLAPESMHVASHSEVLGSFTAEERPAATDSEASHPTQSNVLFEAVSRQDEVASQQERTHVQATHPAPERSTAFSAQSASSQDEIDMGDRREEPLEVPSIVSPIQYEHSIATAWGGVFYLINLSLFLELYGDFTTPAQPGIPLTIWDFLALAGYWLLGEKIRGDPLWRLLAQLAGRQIGEPPGQHFEPQNEWRLPPTWLNPFPPDEHDWEWTVSDNRLRVFHASGFTVIDVPVALEVAPQLIRELAAYDKWQPVVRPAASPVVIPTASGHIEGVEPHVQQWLDWLMPYVYVRLQRAFGIEDNPALLLCQHRAHVHVTPTHLDVLLSLATLPIEIRLSGLDRNAGWVPAAGRHITFYFE